MTGTRPAEILRQLEQSGEPDAELLARFASTKDTHAFAELVRRHGPLVLGVCRRVTGHPQDAEDAFQATFLVLAKKASSLRDAALLGNWLYGVAFRVASKAKRAVTRRRVREIAVSNLPDVPAPATSISELTPILDEELAALSACYRDAIVMCDLREMSRSEAANALGIPEGTLSSRLANGRKKLATRLAKRGITLSLTALPAAVSEATASGAVPNELISKTCGLVADFAAGGAVPNSLARLAEGGFTMRKSLMLVALLAFTLGGAVFAARSNEETPPDPPKPRPAVMEKPDAAPQPKDEAKPKDKLITAYTSTPRMRAAKDVELGDSGTAAWSKDGRFFALQGMIPDINKPYRGVILFAIHNDEILPMSSWAVSGIGELVGFTPDSRAVITEKREYQLLNGFHWVRYESVPDNIEEALKRGYEPIERKVQLDLPETYYYAFAPDGKTYRTVAYHRDTTGAIQVLEVLEVSAATGKAGKSLLKVDYDDNRSFSRYVFAPDGKRLAVFDKEFEKVIVYDLDRGTKQFEYALGGGKLSELPQAGWNSPGGNWQSQRSVQSSPQIVFSYDARWLVVSRAIGQTVVLNTETGKAMPELERSKEARLYAGPYPFSSDGRLLAMSGTNYKLGKQPEPGRRVPNFGGEKAPEQTVWEMGSSFLMVWDTQTGKVVKSWNHNANVVFSPTKPLLAIFEPNGEKQTRIGFWDFSAEAGKK